MLTTTALTLFAFCAAATMIVAARHKWWQSTADERGIALQTVIVMVVLLAVAGGVAAVLLTRGEEAIGDIEDQKIAREAADYNNEHLCEAAGFAWLSGTGCRSSSQQQALKDAATTKAQCDAANGTWTPDDALTININESDCA